MVVEEDGEVIPFASTYSYHPRECYAGAAGSLGLRDLRLPGTRSRSPGDESAARGSREGGPLEVRLPPPLTGNEASRKLSHSLGFREISTYEKHARLDEVWKDMMIVERLIPSNLTPHQTGRTDRPLIAAPAIRRVNRILNLRASLLLLPDLAPRTGCGLCPSLVGRSPVRCSEDPDGALWLVCAFASLILGSRSHREAVMLLGQLECFLVVAELGSLSRAAERMFLTQPSLTARLRGLEEEVGDQLFVRTKRGMRLTEAGSEFLPHAERCLASVEKGKRHLAELREASGGHLRLGALPRMVTYTLPAFLERFTSVYPRVSVSVWTGHSQDILGMVLREEVQLGLARSLDHPDVETLPLYEEELVLVVNPGHRFAREGSVNLEEVGREQLILFDRASSSYEFTRSLFRDDDTPEPRMMELDNIEAAKRMVEHRLGVAFMPRLAVVRAVAAGRLCTVEVDDAPKLRRSVVALRRKDVPLTGAVTAFLELTDRMSRSPSEV